MFRIRRGSGEAFDRFLASRRTDTVAAILPGPDTLRDLSRKHPGREWRAVRLRLVKYTRGTTEYALATTLLDRRRYRVDALADLYHARWGLEEMYKISKQFLEVEQFHGRSERLVKQELFAHFNLIAMTRLLTNRDAALAQHLEGLLLRQRAYVEETLEQLCAWIGTGRPPTAPEPLVPATVQAPGLEMGPAQTRSQIADPMPTPQAGATNVAGPL